MKKIQKIIRFSGTIEVVTGLAIKGAGTDLSIGGADSEVIKNPLNNEPYIPGSSIKGKMRSQLEKVYGTFYMDRDNKRQNDNSGKPCSCGRDFCKVCTVFGTHGQFRNGAASAPTRIIVRDAHMSEDYRARIQELPLERDKLELKGENIINRNSGTAEHPRFMERVPAGASFNFEILLQILEGDDATALRSFVEEGLRLVESSSLGGSGSRGYGQVKFHYETTEESVAGGVVQP